MNLSLKHFRAIKLHSQGAFTLVEIAICLGIIGIALVAIIGILPLGMHSQRDSREETIVGQDASVLFEAVRSGSRGNDDLTNYVYAIVNSWYSTNATSGAVHTGITGYTNYLTEKIGFNKNKFPGAVWYNLLTNGENIVGLMSTPQLISTNGSQISDLRYGGISNHVAAYVSALSGVAGVLPAQDNEILRADAFSYRIYCVNATVAMDTNVANLNYNRNLNQNLHELRTTFFWPLLPTGNTGKGKQTFRATIGGQLVSTNSNGLDLYFYQAQNYTNAP